MKATRKLKKIYIHFRNSPPIIFALGAVSSFAIERLLTQYSTRLGVFQTILAAIILVILAYVLYQLIVYLLGRLFAKEPLPIGENPDKHKALLLLLGHRSDETASVAINYHLPELEMVWLLATEDTKPVGKKIESKFSQDVRFRYVDVADHLDPQATRASVLYATEQLHVLRYHNKDIICDITGGTSAMTAGAFLGVIEMDIDLEMVPATYDIDGTVKRALNPIILDVKKLLAKRQQNNVIQE